MSTPEQPHPRRRGEAKQLLSRQSIIDATMTIMRREGLKKATMRRVAQELETGPASLYVYIRNTAELHAMVIDELLGTISSSQSGDWQHRVEQLVTDYRDVLMGNHGLARSALVIRPSGPHLLALFDAVMAALVDGGAPPTSAAWGADLLLLFATATAAEHAAPEDGDADAGAGDTREVLFSAVRAADIATTPTLAMHADVALAGAPEQRWQWALRSQIAGIVAADEPLT